MKNSLSSSMMALLASAAWIPDPALAQASREARVADRGGNAAGSTEQADEIPTIIVSARRRDEALTTVPASVTAYTSDFLQKQNITTFSDYATKIPNLTFQYGQGGSLLWSGSRQTTIRGVVGNGTTSYYINDTPVPASVSPQTLNLDRIEILKGPQGTLFGASSMGGNLRYITKQPSLSENSGVVQLQAGQTRHGGFDVDANAQANFVLAPDSVALDLAGGFTQESGYITRRFPDEAGHLQSRDGQGRNRIASGSATLRARLADSLEMTLVAIGQSSKVRGFPAVYAHLPAYRPTGLTIDRARDVPEEAKDRWGIGSMVLKYKGDGLSIVSSTSYFKRRIDEVEDDTEGSNQFLADVGIVLDNPVFATVTVQKENRFTQEVRLSFDDGVVLPGLTGIVGFYYQHVLRDTRVPRQESEALADAGAEPPYLGDSTLIEHSNDVAVFGELSYEIAPRLSLSAGLRHYWIKRTTDPTLDTGFIIGPDGASQPGLANRQSGLVPKVVLSYKVGDQGNIYISAAKGFRPGGSQQRLPEICSADLAALGLTVDDVRQFRSDTLWSYEVGAKSQLANRRLNISAAAFQIDWSSIQQSVLLPDCTISFTGNAGKARIRGGEIELSGRPIAHVPLTLQAGVGFTSATLVDPGFLPDLPGSRLAQVPRWTASISAYYEQSLGDDLTGFLSADYSYTSAVPVSDGVGGSYTRQPFNIVNATAGVNFGATQVLLFVKNALDKRLNFGDQPSAGFERQELVDGNLERLPRVIVSRPRQIGLQLRQVF
jgi:outer membrane receptor protein involved in Fe transport